MSEVKIPEGYKQTEVGVIPKDWDLLPAKEMTSFIGGYSFSSNSAQNNGIRWVKIANVGVNKVKWDAKSYLPYSFAEMHSKYLLKENDVVIALTRPILSESLKIARLSLSDTPSLLNQRVAKLEVTSKGDTNFAYYVLQTSSFVAAMNLAMAGTDPPNIGTKALSKIQVLIPPKQEQTAIATALSDIDNLIGSLEKLIAKKEAVKTGTMQQLLTGKTRLPEFATREDGSKKELKQTELGKIPEDWEVKPLGDLSIQIKSGKNIKDKFGIYPLYGSTGQIGKCKIPSYNQEAILVARVGANAGRVNFVDGKYGVSDNTIIINTNSDNSIQFVKSWLVQKDLNTLVFGSGQPLITGTQLKNLLTLAPSKNEQIAIASILSDMDAEIQALQERLEKTKDIKQGMMQQLLTGKVRLLDSSAKSDTQTLASKGELQA